MQDRGRVTQEYGESSALPIASRLDTLKFRFAKPHRHTDCVAVSFNAHDGPLTCHQKLAIKCF